MARYFMFRVTQRALKNYRVTADHPASISAVSLVEHMLKSEKYSFSHVSNDSATIAAIAGLSVGIGFVFVLAVAQFYSAYSSGFPDEDYYSPLIQLKIIDLDETYQAGERIHFRVMQKSAGCVFPDSVIVKHIQTEDVMWQFNSTIANSSLIGCISMASDPSRSQMTMNTQDEQPIVISQPGSYKVIAEHRHVKVEESFEVVE
jgi:hypothetical protein